MTVLETIEVPIRGMDCAECTQHVQKAIAGVRGVESAEVYLATEKAVVRFDPRRAGKPAIHKAVREAGYDIAGAEPATPAGGDLARRILTFLAVLFGFVLFIVIVGEWLGLFEAVTQRIPWPVSLAFVLLVGFPVFRNVVRAVLRRQVIAHTLMTLGVLAAIAVGEWATAAVVVLLMRVGDAVERFTTEQARRAVRQLTTLAPQMARVERDGREIDVPAREVRVGETVLVRPGEKIPVDGVVVGGEATVDQAALTGESIPLEVAQGTRVLAASILRRGSLRVRATHIGPDSTFGRIIRLVEEAESNRADVQRMADRFAGIFLPVVMAIAALTFAVRRDPLAVAAVLVVACSCSIALATPIAMLASIGAGARHGLLIKGGKVLERLARADVLLIDKTGTLTLGKPRLTDVRPLNGRDPDELLELAASAERNSEHPLAEAVRSEAAQRGLVLRQPERFEALPGMGVRARLGEMDVLVGSRRMVLGSSISPLADELEQQGKTLLCIAIDGQLAGVLAAADTLRPEVPSAIASLRDLGMQSIEILTGDQEGAARELAQRVGVPYRAALLPEDKINIVRRYQAEGHTVVMVGDGVNDAPALAQADVGIAMGAVGSDVALEAAHIALMRDDWSLVPAVVRIARRTMSVVRGNFAFSAVYNVLGLSLAALGFLPPVLAAAAQSIPDLGILANSSRLLRQRQ
jgi:Cu+-exporting ATPase